MNFFVRLFLTKNILNYILIIVGESDMDMEKRKKQHMIIMGLIGVIFGMTIGYSALSSILNINGTSKVTGNWDIHFESIEEGTMVNATTLEATTDQGTTATFNVDLTKPGSSAEYLVTVKNGGTIDAVVESIDGIDEINAASPTDIVYSVEDITPGDELGSGASKEFKVKVVWKSTATTIINSSKKATIHVNFVQKTS